MPDNGKQDNVNGIVVKIAQTVAAAVIVAAIMGWGLQVRQNVLQDGRLDVHQQQIDQSRETIKELKDGIESVRQTLHRLDTGQSAILEQLKNLQSYRRTTP